MFRSRASTLLPSKSIRVLALLAAELLTIWENAAGEDFESSTGFKRRLERWRLHQLHTIFKVSNEQGAEHMSIRAVKRSIFTQWIAILACRKSCPAFLMLST